MINIRKLIPVLLILGCIFSIDTYAQRRKRSVGGASTQILDQSKWTLGFKIGANATIIDPETSYDVIALPATEENTASKTYSTYFQNLSPNIAAQIYFFPIPYVGISLQPTYANYNFSYDKEYQWTGTGTQLETSHDFSLNYFELPILLNFAYTMYPVRFYAQAGGYYSAVFSGFQEVDATTTFADGEIIQESNSFSVKNQMNNNIWGYTGGIGIGYYIQTFLIALEANYKNTIDTKFNPSKRFDNPELVSKYYEVMDDVNMQHVEVSLSFTMPIDHIVQTPQRNKRRR